MKLSRIGGVLCCGNVVFDIPVWPVDELKWHTSTWVETILEEIGGNGANTSCTLGKLGIPVRLLSMVGADSRGERLIGILQAAGVDTSGMMFSAGKPTATSVAVINSKGDRAFLHRPGASREMAPADVRFDALDGMTHFHLANPFALPKVRTDTGGIMQRARAAGLTTSMDTGWDSLGRWIDDLGAALPFADLLFVNDSEARMLGGTDDLDEAVENLRRSGVSDVVLKLGADGCSVHGNAGAFRVPGFAVDAVDTTGAGDCFAGAFLAGLHQGWAPLTCARFANAVGAMNVEKIGATAGLGSMAAVHAWMDMKKSA